MLVKYIREKSPIKTTLKIIGDPTYKAIKKLREAMYSNAAAISTTIGGGRNGHIGLIMDTSVYANITAFAYVRPADPGPYAQHGFSDTVAAHVRSQPERKRRA